MGEAMKKLLVVVIVTLLIAFPAHALERFRGKPSGTVESNQKLAAYPHPFDVYKVGGADKAVIYLHGGGGTKESSAYQSGIKATRTAADFRLGNTQILKDNNAIVVYPQGQAIPSNPGSRTWSNYSMTSGQDDVAFLRSLVSHLKSKYGVTKVYVAGHSNGGMMVNRLWCEAPEVFDGFVAFSGPPSQWFLTNKCQPSVAKPILSVVGSNDEVLQNADWEAKTWRTAPNLTQGAAYVDPFLIGDFVTFSANQGNAEMWRDGKARRRRRSENRKPDHMVLLWGNGTARARGRGESFGGDATERSRHDITRAGVRIYSGEESVRRENEKHGGEAFHYWLSPSAASSRSMMLAHSPLNTPARSAAFTVLISSSIAFELRRLFFPLWSFVFFMCRFLPFDNHITYCPVPEPRRSCPLSFPDSQARR